jgi:hypothetical protein
VGKMERECKIESELVRKWIFIGLQWKVEGSWRCRYEWRTGSSTIMGVVAQKICGADGETLYGRERWTTRIERPAHAG